MEVAALCFRLLISVSMLTQVQPQQKAVYPHVVPDRQQLFEYESVSLNCEGLDGETGWRVMKEIKEGVTKCSPHSDESGDESVTKPCTIKTVFAADSGSYWCQAGQKRSNAINITVTDGPVIMESPALPVIKGETVTLSCRHKESSNLTADFYKDGSLIKTNSTGKMTFLKVLKSDEGLYKCNFSQSEESAESWLAVRDHNDTTSTDVCCPADAALRTSGIIVLMLVLGLVVGLVHWRNS